MTKTIEIIVSVYSEEFSAFASLMTAQVSSLILWPPSCPVLYTACGTPSDELTFKTLCRLQSRMTMGQPFGIRWVPFEKPELFRRGYARNVLCKATQADIVFMTDADYIFSAGCLDTLASLDFDGLVFPRQYQIHRSHAIGDAEIARIVPGEVFTPDLSLFEPCKLGFAIGGLQIVPGALARKGYLDATPWSAPMPGATRFQDTKEDKKYRAACGGSSPIDLPGLYRCRHSASAFEAPEKRLASTAGKT